MCAIPGECLLIVAFFTRNVCMTILFFIMPVTSSTPARARVNGVPACMMVMSRSPSRIDAVGAMNTLLPYWDALHAATMKAFSLNECPSAFISYSSG